MKVIISAGGTGGHIYPALTLAKYLHKADPACEVLFIGSKDHMEANIIPAAGYYFSGINAAGLRGSVFTKLSALWTTFKSTFSCRKIIKDFTPDVIVTFGGYVTVPVGVAARQRKIPLIVHEQNAAVGKANAYLGRFAKKVVLCYESVLKDFPEQTAVLLGNPRASEVYQLPFEKGLLTKLGLDENKRTVMIVMGSQGSETVNEIVLNTLPKLVNKSYQTIFVTGKKHYEEIKNAAISAENICVIDYIEQMPYLKVVDLIIARGGATTAAEIAAAALPSIIVPSPYVPNNHQYLNAQAMAEAGACRLIEEVNLSESVLMAAIDSILFSQTKYDDMRKAAFTFAMPNAVYDLIALLNEVADGK